MSKTEELSFGIKDDMGSSENSGKDSTSVKKESPNEKKIPIEQNIDIVNIIAFLLNSNIINHINHLCIYFR